MSLRTYFAEELSNCVTSGMKSYNTIDDKIDVRISPTGLNENGEYYNVRLNVTNAVTSEKMTDYSLSSNSPDKMEQMLEHLLKYI